MGCSRHQASSGSAGLAEEKVAVAPAPQDSFVLRDVDGRTTTLTLKDDHVHLSRITQPVVILHFFTTRVDLGRAMLPYLNDLQRKRAKDVFVLGIVVPETIKADALRTYMQQNDTTFFISDAPDNLPLGQAIASVLKLDANYPLPLTVLLEDGRCVAHYEGITPIEMIRSDLNDLERKTK